MPGQGSRPIVWILYSKHSGKKIDEISSIMERDKYFSPEEAIKFGLIDKVVKDRK